MCVDFHEAYAKLTSHLRAPSTRCLHNQSLVVALLVAIHSTMTLNLVARSPTSLRIRHTIPLPPLTTPILTILQVTDVGILVRISLLLLPARPLTTPALTILQVTDGGTLVSNDAHDLFTRCGHRVTCIRSNYAPSVFVQ